MRARHRKTCLALFAGRAPNDKCDHTEEGEGRGGSECSSSEVVSEVAACTCHMHLVGPRCGGGDDRRPIRLLQ